MASIFQEYKDKKQSKLVIVSPGSQMARVRGIPQKERRYLLSTKEAFRQPVVSYVTWSSYSTNSPSATSTQSLLLTAFANDQPM